MSIRRGVLFATFLAGWLIVSFTVGIGDSLGAAPLSPLATQGRDIFEQKCAACHARGGQGAAEDLQGITTRRERGWLARFISAPEKLRSSGDPVAGRLPPMPDMGRPLAARPGGSQHPRCQLHRQLLLGGLCKGWHRHLGDASDRLSLPGWRPARLRAARLRAGKLFLLVSLQPAPREISLHPRCVA
ncbi:MAG: c-type cytochrome [Syntrophothermus sp.]